MLRSETARAPGGRSGGAGRVAAACGLRGLLLAIAALSLGLFVRAGHSEDAFSLAVIPDVQQETASPRFAERLQWLVDHRAELSLKMVLQCGDMMNFNDDAQYAHQSAGLEVLDRAGVPYATALGNHDTAAVRVDGGSAAPGNVNQNLRNTAKYNQHFPLRRFALLAGTYEPGKIDNAYHVFAAGGLDWLVLNLELWARAGALAWAKEVIASHPHHNIIVLTHAHLNADSTIQQNNGGYGDTSPQAVLDQVLKPYANVRLVFCGHTGSHGYRADTGVHGNTIHQFLQCYHDNQSNPVRLVQIDTRRGTLSTRVYCPSLGQDKQDGSTRTLTGIEWVRPAAEAVAPAGQPAP